MSPIVVRDTERKTASMGEGARANFTSLVYVAAAAYVACHYIHHIQHGPRWPAPALNELGPRP